VLRTAAAEIVRTEITITFGISPGDRLCKGLDAASLWITLADIRTNSFLNHRHNLPKTGDTHENFSISVSIASSIYLRRPDPRAGDDRTRF
jgi:hypothetical protein